MRGFEFNPDDPYLQLAIGSQVDQIFYNDIAGDNLLVLDSITSEYDDPQRDGTRIPNADGYIAWQNIPIVPISELDL